MIMRLDALPLQCTKVPTFVTSEKFLGSSSPFLRNSQGVAFRFSTGFRSYSDRGSRGRRKLIGRGGFLPVDPWAPTIDSESIASQLFAVSLFPYLAFLYFITKSKSAPKLTLFGFYFLLAFVGATIPAGIYAKVRYGTSLSNVDWLHGGAESLLTLTNLFIVLGLRQALKQKNQGSDSVPGIKTQKKPFV